MMTDTATNPKEKTMKDPAAEGFRAAEAENLTRTLPLCPCGHRVKGVDPVEGCPVCPKCGRVGSHWNTKTGEVYSWLTAAQSARAREDFSRMVNGEDSYADLYAGGF